MTAQSTLNEQAQVIHARLVQRVNHPKAVIKSDPTWAWDCGDAAHIIARLQARVRELEFLVDKPFGGILG